MKLSDMAMSIGDDPEDGEGDDTGGSAFKDAAIEAFDLFQKGKKDEAAASLKAAVQACIADYMADDDEEPDDGA